VSVVIDSSIVLNWIYADERTDAVTRVLHIVHRDGAWVPLIWRLEVGNALQYGLKRKRLTRAERDDSLIDLAAMNISVDPDTNTYAWSDTLALAESHGLTLYDAAYVELARRRSLPLASLDRDMLAACRALGVLTL
jgi:predicted nucleic acid-binding protein